MKQLKLPNGENLFFIDKLTALDIYREIYEEEDYFKFGLEIHDGDCVIDAGANIGLFTRYISSKANNLKIYAFEPLQIISDVLKKNIAQITNKSHHIFTETYGLSDQVETVEMEYYPKVSADSTAQPFDEDLKVNLYTENWRLHVTNHIPVAKIVPKFLRPWLIRRFLKRMYKPISISCEFRPLSEFITKYDIKKIDFLKIDTENYEWHVIQGVGEDNWKKINQISMEVHTHIPGGKNLLDQIIDYLREKNFKVWSNKDSENRFEGLGVYMVYGKKNN